MKKILSAILIAVLLTGGAMAELIGDRLEVIKCKEWITLREDPSKKADSLEQMPLGADDLVLLDWDHGDFARLSYDGEVGYALKEYLAVAENFGGEEIAIDEEVRFNINVFLSNFSEQGFAVREGSYLSENADAGDVLDFAINHIWFNKQKFLEWNEEGEWGEYNVRVSAAKVSPTAEKYLNKQVEKGASRNFDLDGNYYYWTETGGHVADGFVCHDSVNALDENRISVYFRVYGAGDAWDNDDCYLTPEEVQQKYWCSHVGHAVIYTGGDLYDRDEWHLERYAVTDAE